ncbi:MAG: UDP-N-acetylmuramoyl-L-alanine--D-glutamate ligase [Candidatus Korobacteraceae bacterium]|jgi:UDP-N-acetylmuramoylalanine--D-glutamate ligase
MDVNGQKVLVVGLGKSGVASALFLRARGARVTVSDAKPQEQFRDEIPVLLEQGVTVETGKHGERTFQQQDLIVASPGVPLELPQLAAARRAGIAIIGEIELAARYLEGEIIAITGSNGKTTTTALTGEVIAAGGRKTLVGGNIGTPAISFVEQSSPDTWIVLEISSFQLETIERFRPRIAAVLNLTPDHLDRHGSMQRYIAAKARIFENQKPADFAVLNADDPQTAAMAAGIRPTILWFSRQREVERGAFVRGGRIFFRDGVAEHEVMPGAEIGLKGAHNLENVLAAVAVGSLAGVEPAKMRTAIRDFKAVEHRLEYVATIAGVDYYNDSKATNVDATIKALEAFPGGIHLILGGKDKGSDYSVLAPLLRERVRHVYMIGAAAGKIEAQIGEFSTGSAGFASAMVTRSETLPQAIRDAAGNARAGEIVLLAPACASFDQFNSYEERGRLFKQEVHALASAAGGRS